MAYLNRCPRCFSGSITETRRIKYKKTFRFVLLCMVLAGISFIRVRSKPVPQVPRPEMENLVRDSMKLAKSMAPEGAELQAAYSKTMVFESHTQVDVLGGGVWFLIFGACACVLASKKKVERRCEECQLLWAD